MNNFKNYMKDLLLKPYGKNEYSFNIPDENLNYTVNSVSTDVVNIYQNIDVNLEYVNMKYSKLINSDVIVREFEITVKNKQYKAFLLYIDGMVNSDLINNYVLKPLMMRSENTTFDDSEVVSAVANNISVRKIKKFDVDEYILNRLLPQNNLEKESKFNDIFMGVNSGNCALFIDTLDVCFNIDVKGFSFRNISPPTNEQVIRGPQESFVENIRTNTSLIRRIVNSENLVIENIKVGKISKTNCAICYLSNIANDDLVSEVKFRVNNIGIDSLLSSGQLEQLIEDDSSYSIPQILSSERPDKATKFLFEGRVVILVNGNPYCLIMPATYIDFVSSPEDTNLKYQFVNFLKFLRIIGIGITLLLPAIYIAMTNFHQELLPTELLFSILASRAHVPFPIIFEILLMEISFELIREAGLRIPSPLGPTIGIVGALILGQAAVSANIVSPILIIIVALTGIASFTIPDFSFGFHIRILRFFFLLLSYIAGFLTIGIGLFVYIAMLCNLKSFGVEYMIPFGIANNSENDKYFLNPIWKRETRPNYLGAKKQESQEHISRKWKYGGEQK